MKFRVTAMVLGLAFMSPLAGSAEDDLHAAIQAREDAWAAAYNAHSKEGLAAFYEEDAVLIPPGSPPVRGPVAIADTLAGLFPVITDLKLVADEVRPLGPDHAVEIGHSEYSAVADDGSTSPAQDDYQVVWHKGADGVWRYVTDMFNAR